MGDYYDRQGDLEAAEEWYWEAIKREPGYSLGYTKLMGLYGQPERFSSNKEKIIPLAEKAIVVAPEGKYEVYLEVADIYKENKQA